MKKVIKVPVVESERGWGSRIDDFMICLTIEDAKKFIEEFNSKNTEEIVPDWYMYADNNFSFMDISEEKYDMINKTENKRIWLSSLK